MKAEHLKSWLRESTSKKDSYAEHWEKLVSIKKLVLRDGHISEALAWTMMVLIHKIGGG